MIRAYYNLSMKEQAPTAAEKALVITQERMAEYGHPADVYRPVASLWSGYMGVVMSPKDVALMMVLFKMGREMTKTGEDNRVDMHGYLLAYERILHREVQNVVVPVTKGT